MLGVITYAFGDAVLFSGLLHGVMGFIMLVVTMLVWEELIGRFHHRLDILQKPGVRERRQAVAEASGLGLFSRSDWPHNPGPPDYIPFCILWGDFSSGLKIETVLRILEYFETMVLSSESKAAISGPVVYRVRVQVSNSLDYSGRLLSGHEYHDVRQR